MSDFKSKQATLLNESLKRPMPVILPDEPWWDSYQCDTCKKLWPHDNFSCQSQFVYLVDIDVLLDWGFDQPDPQLAAKFLHLEAVHLSPVEQVQLGHHQHHGDAPALLLHLLLPFGNTFERLPINAGKGKNTGLGPSAANRTVIILSQIEPQVAGICGFDYVELIDCGFELICTCSKLLWCNQTPPGLPCPRALV